MLPPKQNLSTDQRKLLKLFSGMGQQDRSSLVAFAEFLAGRQSAADTAEALPPAAPTVIPRPEQETVVGAIKRLSRSYHMLERSALLTETASLMTAHVMHGRQAKEVIDDLESLFARYYEQHAEQKD